jgi:hypothetical protein
MSMFQPTYKLSIVDFPLEVVNDALVAIDDTLTPLPKVYTVLVFSNDWVGYNYCQFFHEGGEVSMNLEG